jgi:transposase
VSGGGQASELDLALAANRELLQQIGLLTVERDRAVAERSDLQEKCSILQEKVHVLLDRLYGRRSEKPNALHPLLPFKEEEEVEPPKPPAEILKAADDEGSIREKKRNRRKGNIKPGRRIPDHLPRKRIERTLAEDERVCPCCNKPMHKIGEEITERLDCEPIKLIVNQYVQFKYACPACPDGRGGVKTAPSVPAVIEKGIAEPGLLAQIVVAKYADHLPLHRQQGIFARHGADLSKSTMCDFVADVSDLTMPVVKELKRGIVTGSVIHSDDTHVTVQDAGANGGSRRAFVWVYIGENGDVVFDFTDSRSREGPELFLTGFQGYLQVDAYAGYDNIFATRKVIEVACWAHVRRRFFAAAKLGVEIGAKVVEAIQALYAIERHAAALDPDQRRALRQKDAKPILDAMLPWLQGESQRALPASVLGKAFSYCLKLWPALVRYLEDGRLAIDNNISERAMRRVAVGRKNWMFAGSNEGGKRAANLYSLIASCHAHGVDPWSYLKDILPRLATTPQSRITELTPRGWKASRAQVIVTSATA